MEVKGFYTPCRNTTCQEYHYQCPFCKITNIHSMHIQTCEYPPAAQLKRAAEQI